MVYLNSEVTGAFVYFIITPWTSTVSDRFTAVPPNSEILSQYIVLCSPAAACRPHHIVCYTAAARLVILV